MSAKPLFSLNPKAKDFRPRDQIITFSGNPDDILGKQAMTIQETIKFMEDREKNQSPKLRFVRPKFS